MVIARTDTAGGHGESEAALEHLARWAGLEKAFSDFPADVEAGASRAASVVAALDALMKREPPVAGETRP